MSDFFGPLYGVDHVPVGDEDLLLYWSIPTSREIANYIWDTDVPEVTKPWPCIEYASVRDAISVLSGRTDVTNFLFTVQELAEYRPPCKNCGSTGCADKWCGLRGEDRDSAELGHADSPGAGDTLDVGGGGGPVQRGPEDGDALGSLR